MSKVEFEFTKAHAKYFHKYLNTVRSKCLKILEEFRGKTDYDIEDCEKEHFQWRGGDDVSGGLDEWVIHLHCKFGFKLIVGLNYPEFDRYDVMDYNKTEIFLFISRDEGNIHLGSDSMLFTNFHNKEGKCDIRELDLACEYIFGLVKKYTWCKHCEISLAGYDKECCDDCYCLECERVEGCCVCMEKGLGVWCKLPCGHILHKCCFRKVVNKKCPLCRVEVKYPEVAEDWIE